jgi:uncharacterized protein YneF (UPF0154 family)
MAELIITITLWLVLGLGFGHLLGRFIKENDE